MKRATLWIITLALTSLSAPALGDSPADPRWTRLREEVRTGTVTFRLTEPEEIRLLLGEPVSEETKNDGGMVFRLWTYDGAEILFGRSRDKKDSPFTLQRIAIGGAAVDIGRDRTMVLRGEHDLGKIDRFSGFQNVSLKNLDLRQQAELLHKTRFDSLTEWPPADRLPPGFSPQELLAAGRNPGLGLDALHEEGVDGRGVGIAVIDQPLLLGHQEYTSRILRYDATGLDRYSPKMHGSPIVGIAVGQELGVAPRATLSYFAVPMWKNTNAHYVRALSGIFELNARLPAEEKIRVVSISDGAFGGQAAYEEWQAVVREAEERGLFVVTCATEFLRYGTLRLIVGRDPDLPESYQVGRYVHEDDVLRVPAGNKTTASHRGVDVYTYYPDGGKSWAAPYIAGLAALALQVDPELDPRAFREHLVQSAVVTEAGPVINPPGLIERVRRRQDAPD